MGMGKFWLFAATVATLTSAHTPTPNEGTQPAGGEQIVRPSRAPQQEGPAYAAFNRAWPDVITPAMTVGTFCPGQLPRSVSRLIDTPAPLFGIVNTGDEYGSVLVWRLDPRSAAAIPEPALTDDPARRAVNAMPQAQLVEDIRALTGLSWPRIAQLIGVERQTIYRWRRGEPADEQRLQRAKEVLGVLNDAREEHGTGRELRAWLNRVAPLQALSPYQLLSQGRYDEARFLAMLAPSRVTSISDLARDTSRWDRHFSEEERTYRD